MDAFEKMMVLVSVICLGVLVFALWVMFFSPTADVVRDCIDSQVNDGRDLETAEYICHRRH